MSIRISLIVLVMTGLFYGCDQKPNPNDPREELDRMVLTETSFDDMISASE